MLNKNNTYMNYFLLNANKKGSTVLILPLMRYFGSPSFMDDYDE